MRLVIMFFTTVALFAQAEYRPAYGKNKPKSRPHPRDFKVLAYTKDKEFVVAKSDRVRVYRKKKRGDKEKKDNVVYVSHSEVYRMLRRAKKKKKE
ncbi:MAG: hypothetical protein GF334_08410 [Candidatus Altiarchaeales archaeon]|nr:hypothetical protein [Candidatus Altiarchaeales archaeon]